MAEKEAMEVAQSRLSLHELSEENARKDVRTGSELGKGKAVYSSKQRLCRGERRVLTGFMGSKQEESWKIDRESWEGHLQVRKLKAE